MDRAIASVCLASLFVVGCSSSVCQNLETAEQSLSAKIGSCQNGTLELSFNAFNYTAAELNECTTACGDLGDSTAIQNAIACINEVSSCDGSNPGAFLSAVFSCSNQLKTLTPACFSAATSGTGPAPGIDAGNNQGGTDGGNNQGGTDGGNNQGGTDGGNNQGGTDGGNNQGGTDGGHNQGGTDGGNSSGGGPTILSFGTNVMTLLSNESVTFVAVLTDSSGLQALAGGTLESPDGSIQYGAFQAANQGSYSLTLSWSQINQAQPIDFSASGTRTFEAKFFDQQGNSVTQSTTLTFSCSNASSHDSCNGVCTTLVTDENNCGMCGNACGTGFACESSQCTCTDTALCGPMEPTGAACTSDTGCTGGLCLTQATYGLPGGYCSAPCGTASCATGTCVSMALTFSDGGTESACLESCTGNSDCRSDYTCQNSLCFPSCTNAGFTCTSPDTCNATTGLCVAPVASADAGTLVTINAALNAPDFLALQGSTLYVGGYGPGGSTTATAGSIESLPDTASSAPQTVEASITNIAALVADSKHIYWAQSGTTNAATNAYNNDGAVLQANLAGGTITTLASGLTSSPTALAINGTTVFFAVIGTNAYGLDSTAATAASDGMLLSVPIGGGAVSTLQQNLASPAALAVNSKDLIWGTQGTWTYSTTTGTVTAANNGTVQLAALAANSAVTTLASSQETPITLAINSTTVFWTNAGGISTAGDVVGSTGSVVQVPIAGGTTTTLASAQDFPTAVAVGNGSVYWIDQGDTGAGSLNKVPVGGGTISTLAAGLSTPTALVLSGTNVFFTVFGTTTTNGEVLEFTP